MYKPRHTPLLTAAQQKKGSDMVTSVDVLLAQAFDQFPFWTRLEPPRDIIAEAIVMLDEESYYGETWHALGSRLNKSGSEILPVIIFNL